MATRPLERAARPRAQPPRLRVVRGKRKTKASRRSPLPVVALVVFMVFGVAVLQAWVGQDGLRAAALERDVHNEQERLTLLRAQVAQLSSPQRLRDEAQKMGLVAVSDPVALRVQVGQSEQTSASEDAAEKALETSTP
jgi:cell division protein FtsL